MSTNTTNIFNGTSKLGGVFEAFSNDRVLIKIARANDTTAKNLNKGFLTNGYRIQFQRGVQPRRFLNVTETYYNVGYGTGTLQLDGIVGSKDAFDALLSNKNEDICNPLIIEIYPSFLSSCSNGQVTGNTDNGLAYICGNCMAQTVGLTGNVDPQGIVLNTGTLVFQIGSLKTTTVPSDVHELAASITGRSDLSNAEAMREYELALGLRNE